MCFVFAGSLTGTTSANSLGGITGLQNFGNNLSSSGMGSGMNGLGSNPNSGMDALSQAYSGIQQYAGLSGLLSPGKGSFHQFFHFSDRCAGWMFVLEHWLWLKPLVGVISLDWEIHNSFFTFCYSWYHHQPKINNWFAIQCKKISDFTLLCDRE